MFCILTLIILGVQSAVYQSEPGDDLEFEVYFQPPKLPTAIYLMLQSDGVDYVYLELKNSQYELTIQQGENHEIYTLPAVQPSKAIIFEWPTKIIDGHVMRKVLHQGNISLPELDTCKLTTPIRRAAFYTDANIADIEASDLNKLTYQRCTTDNDYFILIPIFILCAIASRLDLFWTLLRRYRRVAEEETAV